MARKIAPSTIHDYGLEVANLSVPDERAAEIAPEVEALNRTALGAAAALDLNDEPAQFTPALIRNRRQGG